MMEDSMLIWRLDKAVERRVYKIYVGDIDNADVGRVKIGDEIKYNIAALPNSQYGTVSGEVKKIASDVLVQNGMYSGYYLVEGSIDAAELVDRDGNVGKIVAGMQTEVRIVTQRKTIIKYLLEKLNLF